MEKCVIPNYHRTTEGLGYSMASVRPMHQPGMIVWESALSVLMLSKRDQNQIVLDESVQNDMRGQIRQTCQDRT